jgi:hypothetical protein
VAKPAARQIKPIAEGDEGPERFDLRSHAISEEKLAELLRLFPEARTEDDKIDFNRLKLALGESVDAGSERYGRATAGRPVLAQCWPSAGPSTRLSAQF